MDPSAKLVAPGLASIDTDSTLSCGTRSDGRICRPEGMHRKVRAVGIRMSGPALGRTLRALRRPQSTCGSMRPCIASAGEGYSSTKLRPAQTCLKYLIPSLALLTMTEPTSAAGFNCASSKLLPDEKTVCSDATLSRMDDNLNEIYKEIVDSRSEVPAATSEQERKNQRAFLPKRKSCGTDVGCIRSLYTARLAELKAARGVEDIEPEKAPQPAALVDQALDLFKLALKCSSEPVREGYALYYKYEHVSFGDRVTLRVKQTEHYFEGFKFPNGQPVQSDMPIPGVNAALQSTSQATLTVPLRSIGQISINKNVRSLSFGCVDDKPCIDSAGSSGPTICKSWNGTDCSYGSASSKREQTTGFVLSAICSAHLKDAAEALSILVSAATYGQTK